MAFWRLLLSLAALVALTHAGGRVLSADESANFLNLFRRLCGSGSSTQEGNTFYYCKTSNTQPQTVTLNHEHDSSRGGEPQKQVIFIQPPPTNFVHNVALRGSGKRQQTEIYVLPNTATHQLEVQDNTREADVEKPNLYYLNDNSNNANGNGNTGFNGGSNSNTGIIGGNRPGAIASFGNRPGGPINRPSAPLPSPSDPAVIGIGNGFGSSSSGFASSSSVAVGSGYNAYGAPGQRNQRNVQYRTL